MKIHPSYEAPRRSDRRKRRLLIGALVGALCVGGAVTTAVVLRGKAASTQRVSGLLAEPGAVRYRFAVGRVDAAGEDAAAIEILGTRVEQQPSPFDAAELAELYYRRGQRAGDDAAYEAAERFARQSLELLEAPNPARLTLAKLANVRHDFREAIELAREQLATPSGDARGAHLVIATAQLALGELEGAAAAADAAIALVPDSNGYLARALVMQARGRDADAAADFARAATAEQAGDPEGAARLRALWARFLLRRGAYREAALVLDEAQRIAPELAIAIAQRGELMLRTGKPRDAVRLFERAFERSRQVRYLLDEARARELSADRENADRLRARVETIVRGDPRAHRLDLVEVLVDRGTPGGVQEAIALAEAELGVRGSIEVRFQLARALARAGRLGDAKAHVDAAIASGAREAQVFELAAHVERRVGNAARAAEHTRSADALDPGRSGWRALGIEAR